MQAQNQIIKKNNAMYYYTLLKVILVGFLISSFLLLFFAVTGAFLSKQSVTQNTLNIGNVQIVGTALSNPYTFLVSDVETPSSVTNLSNTHIVVRAYLNFYWEDNAPLGDVSAVLSNSNWTQGEDGFFYYNQVLTPAGGINTVANFLTGMEVNDPSEERVGKTFVLTIMYEGAQYANLGYANLWTNAPNEWLNLIAS